MQQPAAHTITITSASSSSNASIPCMVAHHSLQNDTPIETDPCNDRHKIQ